MGSVVLTVFHCPLWLFSLLSLFLSVACCGSFVCFSVCLFYESLLCRSTTAFFCLLLPSTAYDVCCLGSWSCWSFAIVFVSFGGLTDGTIGLAGLCSRSPRDGVGSSLSRGECTAADDGAVGCILLTLTILPRVTSNVLSTTPTTTTTVVTSGVVTNRSLSHRSRSSSSAPYDVGPPPSVSVHLTAAA